MAQLEQPKKITTRSSRKLRGKGRVARHARNIVWESVLAFLKRAWIPLTVLLLLPIALAAIIPFKMSSASRWTLLGAMGATGLWLDVIMVILWSGIAPTVMGIEGETQTAEILDDFAGKEWTLINGLRFRDQGDIDHILIGPAGLLVFESKWSGERWPMELRPKGYLGRQVKWAIKQVKTNRDQLLAEFRDKIGEAPIYSVCVLWSAESSAGDDKYFFRDSVFGIRGPALKEWLTKLPKNAVGQSEIRRISESIEEFAHLRDSEDILADGPFRPTLDRFLVGSVVLPILAFFVPAFVLAGAAKFNHDYIIFASMGCIALISLFVRLRLKMRIVAHALFLGLVTDCLYVLAYVNHWVSR